MPSRQALSLLALPLLCIGLSPAAGAQAIEKPAALVADGIPEVNVCRQR
jgi:hypothetical protein